MEVVLMKSKNIVFTEPNVAKLIEEDIGALAKNEIQVRFP